MVIHGGFEVGVTSGGPHRRAFVGTTYSIANRLPCMATKVIEPSSSTKSENQITDLAECGSESWI